MIRKPSLSLVVVLVGCFVAPVSAIPLQEDPGAGPGEGMSCDAGHLFEFPFQDFPNDAFSPVHMVSPTPGSTQVPRNVEIVLAGFISDLDSQPPFLLLKLRNEANEEVPSTRNGLLLRPLAPLAPLAWYRVSLELADPESCPECGIEQSFPFTTGEHFDVEPPEWSGEMLVQALVLSEQERQCGFGGGFDTTHLLLARLPGLLAPDITRISVAVRAGTGAPVRVLDTLVRQDAHHFIRPGSEPVALGDEVLVALTPIDIAGNAGAATSVRVRARSFADLRDAPFDDLSDLQCSLPTGAQAALPTTVPSNARFVVDLPLEPVPLALVNAGGAGDDDVTLPLQPIEHLPAGQVLVPPTSLPIGASLQLVALPCPSCACVGCNTAPRWTFTVEEADERAPEPPVVTALLEDLDPPPALDTCHADTTALVVMLAAGEDDTTAPEHLRYDVVLRLEDQLAVEAGRALPALLGDDGSVAVRVDTSAYGRLLSQPFELDVLATDLAGNRSSTTVVHEGAVAAGCTSTRVPTGSLPLAGLLFVALGNGLALRRRERSSVR